MTGQWIVTTTINAPTLAIEKYDSLKSWNLLVTGDRKTPKYQLKRGVFLSWDEQRAKYPDLCELIGPDSVARGRMVAFIEAHKRGAEIVASIDDDCYPYDNWGQHYVGGATMAMRHDCKEIAFDPLHPWNPLHWHRGFPIELVPQRTETREIVRIKPLIQANLCDGESDFDAMYRLASNDGHQDYPPNMMPYFARAFSPINTQNTIISGRHLKDHFANIPFIGRADDIWAGYLFQAKYPNRTIYFRPTTKHDQRRTRESVVHDFKNELYAYEKTYDFLICLKNDGIKTAMQRFLPKKSLEAIECYRSYFN